MWASPGVERTASSLMRLHITARNGARPFRTVAPDRSLAWLRRSTTRMLHVAAWEAAAVWPSPKTNAVGVEAKSAAPYHDFTAVTAVCRLQLRVSGRRKQRFLRSPLRLNEQYLRRESILGEHRGISCAQFDSNVHCANCVNGGAYRREAQECLHRSYDKVDAIARP